MTSQPEAFSRVLIGKELENSKWNLLDNHQVRFETHTRDGRVEEARGVQSRTGQVR